MCLEMVALHGELSERPLTPRSWARWDMTPLADLTGYHHVLKGDAHRVGGSLTHVPLLQWEGEGQKGPLHIGQLVS